ncbi:nucleotidyltransferase domain-containing protein [Bradyrhizobium sp. WSM471]|uniref:nucleotidyltransferase domain-containing protein n=1 Tax=Bradyrhizobium sp. WSM471 TaxID=319017 RepID=UPI00024D2AB3|nr:MULTISPECIES: nucleotidyltransferase [Bradyrhizobium]EHR03044.1 hypothetical protein Bra471DRAFT_03810 [Bradyrhizobium sp. WSM471]UFW38285.1 nucleotidyltransferase [Bradyrhizobium canariense]
MNVQTRFPTTDEAAKTLEALAEELEIPQYRYEQAETSYRSLGDWLNRSVSSIRQFDPQVHVQGSFGLGTAIPPISDDEHYDVDAVCEFRNLTKGQISQAELKRRLGQEIRSYAASQSMKNPVEERRRCWTLVYADGAQFHMDVTPGIPNAADQRSRLERIGLDAAFAGTAIAITDVDHPTYRMISQDWPRSNPRGYLDWFRSCMAKGREQGRSVALDSTEPMPDYKLRTPLQRAVMILKRHRDIAFADRFDERPISVILTTLAAHAYGGERKIADALFSILRGMDRYIVQRGGGEVLIANPSDRSENFADKWSKCPERKAAFYQWLAQARKDFEYVAVLSNEQLIAEHLAKGVGLGMADRAKKRATRGPGAPTILTGGLVRNEAQARSSAVQLHGDRRNA